MIKIDKTIKSIPAILQPGGKGDIAIQDLKAKYLKGQTTFKFAKTIYNDKTVKETLSKIQHGKCCFCEAKFEHVSSGDVEHYRPKGGYKQIANQKIVKPGYYWLAYDYDNLFLACEKCNRSFKKNLFPLADSTKRAVNHTANLLDESPLLIHPANEDPSQLLVFEKEMIKPKNGSVRGKTTINVAGLNRKKLADNRLELLEILQGLAVTARSSWPEAPEAKKMFKKLGDPKSQYSLMIRCNFPDLV